MSLQFLQDLPLEFKPLRSWLEAHVEFYISIEAEKVGRLRNDTTGDPLSVKAKLVAIPTFSKIVSIPKTNN
mgnify:CR=1 FL=1